MAIDGVKIIDSDSGYDIYNAVTERYKDGENVDRIIEELLSEAENFCVDELYTEIYWTAFAYSLWKIGYRKDEIRERALKIIERGASDLWDEIDKKAKKQRQKALDKLAVQLQTDNPKPLKKSSTKNKKEPYFQVGDVLSIEMEEGYGICFVSMMEQTPRKLEYHFACVRWCQQRIPTMEDFLQSEIACGMDNGKFALRTDCWFNHKDLSKILEKLKIIGKVRLYPLCLWSLSPASQLSHFYREITDDKKYWGRDVKEVFELVEEVLEEI